MNKFDYDLLVIGSGPAGQKAAIQAAKLNKRVGIVERRAVVGGVCINTGTIPSKTLREAALYLSGYRQHKVYGASYQVKEKITVQDLLFRTDYVIRNEIDVTRHQLMRNGVEIFSAIARFIDPHTIELEMVDGSASKVISAANIVIAVGTDATRDPHIPFDGRNVLTSDDVLTLNEIPRTLTVVGGGVIGIEYASIFSALGVRVTVIDRRPDLLSFLDEEIVDCLIYHLRQHNVVFRLGEAVEKIELMDDAKESVLVGLASGKKIRAEKVLYSIGRTGATGKLNLEVTGLQADSRGRIEVNEAYQTRVDHIYAVGDVIGFPSLASTSMEQGRIAAAHALGHKSARFADMFPYGIYTIPEISVIGKTEKELTDAGVPYEIGKAKYKEIARGQIIGDDTGILKMIFHSETRKILGVHILGDGATELVHIGQAVMAFGGTIDYFIDTVFNYPTLAECYKTAAFSGLNRLLM